MKPLEDARPAEDTPNETVTTTQFFSLEGCVDPLELILHALEATGATGVGRLLRLDGGEH